MNRNKSDRRTFLKAGMAAVTLPAIGLGNTQSNLPEVDTRFRGHESQWTFVGSSNPWRETEKSVLLSPTWTLFKPGHYSAYADDLTREDFAFLNPVLSDVDFSVDFQIRDGSVTCIGAAFRAQDSLQMYCVDVIDIDPRRTDSFNVILWRQDAKGFREQLAAALVPHPRPPVVSPHNYEEWEKTSPGWSTLRVRATGPRIEVWVRGQKAIDTRDSTYMSGRIGLIARWAVLFRNFKASGTTGALRQPWHVIPGTWPKYMLPFDGRLGDFETYPQIARDEKTGTLYVIANVAPTAGWSKNDLDTGIVRSLDGGKIWVDPEKLKLGKFVPTGAGYAPNLYVHKDGHLTCFYDQRPSIPKGPLTDDQMDSSPKTIGYSESYDGGHTWSETREVMVSGKPLSKTVAPGTIIYVYSPVERLRNGTLLLPCYHWYGVYYGSPPIAHASSIVFRSMDDGATWAGPYTIDNNEHDTNEVSVAELADGRLLAYMRSNHATHMWESYSNDEGKTWSPIKQTSITAGDCPTFLMMRSGAIVFAYRSMGTFLKVSPDGGKTWGPTVRITPSPGMTGMVELPDGRILIVYYTGYREPARIRAQFLRVNGDVVVPA